MASTHKTSIAIVGIGGVFPDAPTLDRFWDNIRTGVDAARDVPEGRWYLSKEDAFSPHQGDLDKVYSTRGCFIDAGTLSFEAGCFADGETTDDDGALRAGRMLISQTFLETLDPAFHLLLHAGREAFIDAGLAGVDRSKTGVIIGNIALPSDSSSAIARETLGRCFEEKVLGESTRESETNPLNQYVAGLPAGVLAKALGLGGGTHTLDAACASSLYALKYAIEELRSGRADTMLAGGLSRPDCLYTQMGFSQLRALSPSGQCAPFDARGDGLVVGEGAGIFVLKRTEDAVRDGDHIYGVLRGIGLSNDIGGKLLAPTSEGQLRAMRAAYAEAGWSPGDVDLIECHATGTPVGDAVEFESLKQLWGADRGAPSASVIGSVKSNIGHLLTAAGSAALMKVLLSFKHETLPPTANFSSAPDDLQMEISPFRVLQEAEPWERRAVGTTRKAAVSAFGFGGINAHVLVEEWVPAEEQSANIRIETPTASRVPVAVVGMETCFGPWTSLRAFQERVLGGDPREPTSRGDHWWGAEASAWYRHVGLSHIPFSGHYIDAVEVPLAAFRIPPKELEEMLPQQLLMLQTAVQAWRDAGLGDGEHLDTGVYVGLGLDPNTTNFHHRWSVRNRARAWAQQRGDAMTDQALDAWVDTLRDAAGPPLTANRTMGALASVAASRIARELRIGGPSFALSSEESSGIKALEAGFRALQRGDINTALVGAVDLAGDVRTVLSTHETRSFSRSGKVRPFDTEADGTIVGEGAAALVLKRLDDALRDGDRVYGVIRGIGNATGGGTEEVAPNDEAYTAALARAYVDAGVSPDSVTYIEAHGSGDANEDAIEAMALTAHFQEDGADAIRCALGSVKADIGHAGAASGLVSIAKACLCLYQEIIPPLRQLNEPRPEIAGTDHRLVLPRRAQHWLQDRSSGVRRAAVSSMSVDGNCVHVVLEGVAPSTGGVSMAKRAPLGACNEALFAVFAATPQGLVEQLGRLKELVEHSGDDVLEALARQWYQDTSEDVAAASVTLIARAVSELLDQIQFVQQSLVANPGQAIGGNDLVLREPYIKDRVFYTPDPLGADAKIAFVFPGSGNHYPDMGRALFVQWPEILRHQDDMNKHLKSQVQADYFWDKDSFDSNTQSHKTMIFGQVALGTAVSDLVRLMGVEPTACIGYSLGETAGLFALGAWTERDVMLERINASPLFTTELAGDCEAARKRWGLPKHETVDWVLGVIDRPMKVARSALKNRKKVYPLIANTLQETVIGGNRKAVEKLIRRLECQFIPLEGVTTVHCEVVKEVEQAYRELHLLETTPPEGVRFYSGASGGGYDVTRDSAADSVLAQAIEGVDFPAVIDAAYSDGARIFLEMGPGNSCTRMISKILADGPHLSRSFCYQGQDAVSLVLRGLGQLIAEGVPVDLAALYGHESRAVGLQPHEESTTPTVSVPLGGKHYVVPAPPHAPTVASPPRDAPFSPVIETSRSEYSWSPMGAGLVVASPLLQQIECTEAAKATAHDAFLKLSASLTDAMTAAISQEMSLLHATGAGNGHSALTAAPASTLVEDRVALDRQQCMEFAIGSIGKVLGDEFAPIDEHPTRVRLPDEPLMLVDRIVEIEGTPCSMQSGRVVTEHDVLHEGWYLDGGRIPTCIAVEAGQADLFLSAYLGIDFKTRGLARYRLLDADVTFHSALPQSGEIIRYDIRIEKFFQHGAPWFFRFGFESTVNGRPLLTMENGCAGFFTDDDLDAGQGIMQSKLDLMEQPGKRPDDWQDFVSMAVESYDGAQLEALRSGDLGGCFGAPFDQLPLENPLRIPSGAMNLVHRVVRLEPQGGRYGLGQIRAEADIHPDDWFLTCHFVDDKVMPGTLMYECCLHTLRIFLLRMGWVGDAGTVVYEPVPGVTSRLKCRGQVLDTTQLVRCEVSIKELGYGPEPFAIADALMYSDGKPIVEIANMSVRLTGLTREQIAALWADHAEDLGKPKPAIYDYDKILAFSSGNPSDAFGAPYKVFDGERRIARLPRPPYQFLDRITNVEGAPWECVAGSMAEAQYDVPVDAWYFSADRQPRMSFAVLLEVALQPCGWLAAYVGSALTSETDLKFRNLGGTATQYLPVTTDTGTLTVRVKLTSVSLSGGMIIQHYSMAIFSGAGKVYEGTTYFGFFSAEALADQVGIREAERYVPTEKETARGAAFDYPDAAPFPDTQLKMVDLVTLYDPAGGPSGFGFIRGTKRVNPEEWFFEAHFYQDPVCPGSLGLESFMQLLKVVAAKRWNLEADAVFQCNALEHAQEWIYRGQIIPEDDEVTVEAAVTEIDDAHRLIRAEGFLIVDGRIIYQMKAFTLQVT